MERNREARRASMVASSNGISRRRHRTNSLRDPPDEDGPVEFSESVRLRERVKKDRDRDRDRERERASRSKRRRGDDSSQESVNDDEDEEDDDNSHLHHSSNGGGAGVRLLPPNQSAAAAAAVAQAATSITHHHHHSSSTNSHHQHHQNHHLQHRKTFPPSTGKPFRAAPVWKSGNEMIGVSVPRKARSAHPKRTHDWISGSSCGVGDQIHRQASTSPVRQSFASTSTPSPAPPLSPSSSNASGRRKIKVNGSKQRPLKSSSKSTSSNPEELEIEIAEVLYGLKSQPQAPLKKEIASNDIREVDNRSCGDPKSRVSSPVSGSRSPAILPSMSNSSAAAPFSAVAPKRKRPRQVSENQGSASVRSSPSSATPKAEIDQTMKAEAASPNFEKTAPVENGSMYASLGSSTNSQGLTTSSDPMPEPMKVDSEIKPVTDELPPPESRDVVGKEEVSSPRKESHAAAADDSNCEDSKAMAASVTTKLSTASEVEGQREEKIQIDLMAPPPPQFRSSPDREGKPNFTSSIVDNQTVVSDSITETKPGVKHKEDDKSENNEAVTMETVEKKTRTVEEAESQKKGGDDIGLQLDLEKLERDSGNKFQKPSQKPAQQLPPPVKSRNEEHPEKAIQSSSLPLPLSMASWPGGGLPPMGYMAPHHGVMTMDGSTVPSAPMQPTFSHPRPKRCATHCYIARNIHLYQQFIKMNPFWLPTASSASLFVSKACNLNVVPTPDLHGNIAGRSVSSGPDKGGQGIAILPGLAGKDKCSQAPNVPDPAQRKQQQILLQQALPPVAPNNLLPGHTFIFPLNQQQPATSARPGPAKSPASTCPQAASNASNSAAGSSACATTGGTAAISFSYPNLPPNETPYLAILQNNAYFPIPAVGAPLNYRGTHAPSLPLFNGSLCSSQMIHPSQLQQQQQQQPTPSSQSQQMQPQGQQNTSGSSSSHKLLQNHQKQRPQGIVNGNSGSGNLHNFPASKSHPPQPQQPSQNQHISPSQPRHIENELRSEDNPSTAESQGSRAPVNMHNQNCVIPMHTSNFSLMTSAAAGVVSTTSGNGNQSEKKQQLPQQQGSKAGVESMPPQSFSMSFTSINGASAPGFDLSSMAPNSAIFQNLPEVARKNAQIMFAAAAAQAKKNYRDECRSGSGDPTTADDERKGSAGKGPAATMGQSITFSRSDLLDASGSKIAANNIDSSRSITLASASGWNERAAIPTSMGSNVQLQAQLQHKQQQQMVQLQMQQQQLATAVARSKTPPTSNCIVYSEHLPPTSVGVKFPNAISGFPQNLGQTSNNCCTAQSPQWKGSAKTSSSQMTSTLTPTLQSLKNISQQQPRIQPNHTQISFGANQKSSTTSQGQHPSNSNQSQSSSMVVGSPTTSSISKGASGSPKTTSASMSNKMDQTSSLAAQQGKTSVSIPNQKSSPASGRNVPSILGNSHIPSTSSSVSKTPVPQHSAKGMQQSQLFFSSNYAQAQASSSSAPATSGYYIQTRRPEQLQAPLGSTVPTSSTGMLTLCPVTLGGGSTSDPAKAIAAASNMRGVGLPSQSILHTTQFAAPSSGSQHQIFPAGFSYVQPVPTAVQVKPTEQKQPAGSDNLHACWQPEKK